MARVTVAAEALPRAGLVPTMSAPVADGDSVPWGSRYVLVVDNADVSGITVTVQTPKTVDGLAVAENAIAVAAGNRAYIPLDAESFRRATGADIGRVYVDYSAVANVTRAVLQVPA